ncbi:MAG: type II secretion system F family protein [Deltaproteobacteria bacterium]|nr:type II secretion system F family protein [Deltaproteobacteria bacterium]
MPIFTWEGKTRKGEVKKGEMDAPNEATVNANLSRQGIIATSVKVKTAAAKPARGKVSTKDLVVFTRMFATMIDAGLPLVQCLDILSSQQENKYFKSVLTQVKADVESGSTFADALKKHPKAFDELYVNLVAAGEVGGILDTILNRLAAYIEKAMKLKSQVKGAMVYPVSIIVIASVVIAGLLIFVIPIFAGMFADFGKALPMPTQIVINMSEFLQKWWWAIGGTIFGTFTGLKKYYATDSGNKVMDALFLKLPVFGPLLKKVAVAKFTRTLGTMISSGVPIMDGLEIVAKTAGNRVIEAAIMKTRESISAGKTISEPLMQSKIFPSMVCQMISVGEATGALDNMLNKIADFYDDEVDSAVDAMTALMEPALMAFLGVTVGGLVIAMYLPIFALAGASG